MLRLLCKILFVILLTEIAFQLSTIICKIPPTPKKLTGRTKAKGFQIDQVLLPLYRIVAKVMYMEKDMEKAQKDLLIRAGIVNLEPKEIMARSILGAVFGLLFAVWGYLMNNTFFILMGVVLGVALFGMSNGQASQRLKEKDAEIKQELPKFVGTIVVALRTDKNIIRIIESYAKDARPALKSDLEVLLSQMQTGNIETALRNFDTRIGAPEVTSLCTSLIYIENGVDQTAALQYLESDMRQEQATMRHLELEKLPGKMRRSFIPVGAVLIAMFFYTIFIQIFDNFALFL